MGRYITHEGLPFYGTLEKIRIRSCRATDPSLPGFNEEQLLEITRDGEVKLTQKAPSGTEKNKIHISQADADSVFAAFSETFASYRKERIPSISGHWRVRLLTDDNEVYFYHGANGQDYRYHDESLTDILRQRTGMPGLFGLSVKTETKSKVKSIEISLEQTATNEVKDKYASEYGICIHDTNEWLLISSEGTLTYNRRIANADARTLMRIYMMERFLERLAQSEYRDNFIIKGGILVTAMIGVVHRSTMDIDTSMKNLNLSAEDALRVVNQVKDIDLDDGVSFDVKDVSNIMDEMEYPGIRVTMNANVGRLITPLKIDISTGDVITPRAIEFNYDLLLEDRSISLWSYNLETILAEKLQTVLARGILNTRMRDFYDIRMLLDTYEDKVNKAVLKDAFAATCKKRGMDHLQEQAEEIIKIIEADEQLQVLWRAYQKKYSYAAEIDYVSVISGVRKLMDWIR